jgi:hypothetical protein
VGGGELDDSGLQAADRGIEGDAAVHLEAGAGHRFADGPGPVGGRPQVGLEDPARHPVRVREAGHVEVGAAVGQPGRQIRLTVHVDINGPAQQSVETLGLGGGEQVRGRLHGLNCMTV